jgi:hypothetical protein
VAEAAVPTAEVVVASTAEGATLGVGSTAEAMAAGASMADRPMADITAVVIAEECMAAPATLVLLALGGPGRLSAEEFGTLRPDSTRLPDPGVVACQQLAAGRWVRLTAKAWPLGVVRVRASLTGISIPSAGSALRVLRTLRSTTLPLWGLAA